MHITLIDDSIPFDGDSPLSRPLGGAEKAFVHLAAALAARDHEVVAINRCAETTTIDGVTWLPWDLPRPPETDVLIAFRKPALLNEVDNAAHQTMWVWGPAGYLNKAANQIVLEKERPSFAFTGTFHLRSWTAWREFRRKAIIPGVSDVYRQAADMGDEAAPFAITTTHPLHGLQKMVRLWRDGIYPKLARAELHVYSAALARCEAGGEVPENLKSIFEDVKDAESDGVWIKTPMADVEMSAAYRNARLHLYPVIATEIYASTLAESQASGLPAVVMASQGDTQFVSTQVRNGQSGYLAPDDSAFVNLSVEILAEDRKMYKPLHRDALTLQRGRTWMTAAIEFEELWQ